MQSFKEGKMTEQIHTNTLRNMRCFFSISYFTQMGFIRQKTYQKQNYSSRFQARIMKSFHFEELLGFFLLNIRKKSILQAHTLIRLAGFHLRNNKKINASNIAKTVFKITEYYKRLMCILVGFKVSPIWHSNALSNILSLKYTLQGKLKHSFSFTICP